MKINKFNFSNYPFVLIGMLLILSYSCKKSDDSNNKQIPSLTTTVISAITQTTVTCGGNITYDGGAVVTERGVCWNNTPKPTIADNKTTDGTGTGSFISNITGLMANTTYYTRAYATNNVGTSYGNELIFNTVNIAFNPNLNYETLSDIDGNTYKTIKIGTQIWMAENLKTTKYSNGTSIPLVSDSQTWKSLTTPAYCWYNNDSATYKATYGALYNRYTIKTGNLCPIGWHVPTYDEWLTLCHYLNDSDIGSKLKEVGTSHWRTPNEGADNSSGFTALPGSFRENNGNTVNISYVGCWWLSSETIAGYTDYLVMDYRYKYISYDFDCSNVGYSVRCLKDN